MTTRNERLLAEAHRLGVKADRLTVQADLLLSEADRYRAAAHGLLDAVEILGTKQAQKGESA